MPAHAYRFITKRIRGVVLVVVLLGLLVRASIPDGFMPVSAQSTTGVSSALSFCYSGLSTAQLQRFIQLGYMPDGQHSEHQHHPCIYSSVANKAVLPTGDGLLLLLALLLLYVQPRYTRPVMSLQPCRGPPLGARAPPHI